MAALRVLRIANNPAARHLVLALMGYHLVFYAQTSHDLDVPIDEVTRHALINLFSQLAGIDCSLGRHQAIVLLDLQCGRSPAVTRIHPHYGGVRRSHFLLHSNGIEHL